MRILRPARFPGDSLMLGESRYRLKRVGREEWLDDHANPTDDVEQATDFASATESVMWAQRMVEEPWLYHFEEFFTVGC